MYALVCLQLAMDVNKARASSFKAPRMRDRQGDPFRVWQGPFPVVNVIPEGPAQLAAAGQNQKASVAAYLGREATSRVSAMEKEFAEVRKLRSVLKPAPEQLP